jgi:membrane protein implicated in regulation of membrane protease activity
MLYWQIFGIVAVIAMLLEMTMPSFFFLNFAFAGIFTAAAAVWIDDPAILWIIFSVVTLISLFSLRPFCLKNFRNNENSQTGVESEYHGKIAKVIEPITVNSGSISIYEERWDARLANDGEEIPAGADVKIVGNESLIMYVEKV